VTEWLRATRWSRGPGIAAADLRPVTTALGELGLIDRGFAPEQALLIAAE